MQHKIEKTTNGYNLTIASKQQQYTFFVDNGHNMHYQQEGIPLPHDVVNYMKYELLPLFTNNYQPYDNVQTDELVTIELDIDAILRINNKKIKFESLLTFDGSPNCYELMYADIMKKHRPNTHEYRIAKTFEKVLNTCQFPLPSFTIQTSVQKIIILHHLLTLNLVNNDTDFLNVLIHGSDITLTQELPLDL